MQTIGFIGVGNIGMVICKHLIDSGHKVLGYRRSSLAEFEKIGGITAKSPADVSSQADIVFSCLPGGSALDEVVTGPNGLLKNARRGQVVVELGSHPIAVKERQVARFAEKGVAFIDGEVSGTPGMVMAKKAPIYLAGDTEACKKLEPTVAGTPVPDVGAKSAKPAQRSVMDAYAAQTSRQKPAKRRPRSTNPDPPFFGFFR